LKLTFYFSFFKDRGIVELQGWTIAVEEGGDTCAELNGGDFVLDGIGELVNINKFHTHTIFKGKRKQFLQVLF